MDTQKTGIAMLGIILGVICLVTASALGFVNGITEPIIKEGAVAAQTAAFSDFFPDGKFEESTIPPTKNVDKGYLVKQGDEVIGHVITARPQGYGGPIEFAVGFDKDLKVVGISFLAIQETSGVGDRITGPEFIKSYIGKDKSTFGEVDALSGATISFTAFSNSLIEASDAASQMGGDFSNFVVAPDPTAKSAMHGLIEGAKYSSTLKTGKYNIKKDGAKIGVAVSLKATGYNKEKPMQLFVAFDNEGKVLNLDVWSCNETIGLGAKVAERPFLDLFIGDNAEFDVDTLTGATISSKAIRTALEDASAILGFTPKTRTIPEKKPEPVAPPPEAPADGYADGTYTGIGKGFGDAEITATITISGGKITDVLLATKETHPVSPAAQKEAYDKIAVAIREANAPVDTVAGVTLSISLGGVKTAVSDALAQAAPATGVAAPILDGTFTGTGKGFGDAEITATITASGGKITDVKLDTKEAHPVSPAAQKEAFDKIAAAIKAASGPVDAVAGVTLTFSIKGVNDAVAAALATTAGNEPATPPAATDPVPPTPEVPVKTGDLKDGTYVGTGKGFGDAEVTAAIIVLDGKFNTVKITSKETHPVSPEAQKEALSKIGAAVKKAGGPVDTVAGVTLSATLSGANAAVKNAMASTPTGGTPPAEPTKPVEPATPSEPAKADGLKDGTYSGSGKGFGDAEIKASVTVSDGKVSGVKLTTAETHPVSPEAQKEAYGKIEAAIVKANGPVDSVSGVTIMVSLGGVKTAVTEALSKAK